MLFKRIGRLQRRFIKRKSKGLVVGEERIFFKPCGHLPPLFVMRIAAIRKPLVGIEATLFLIMVLLSGCTQTSQADQRFVGEWAGRFSWSGSINTSVPANISFHSDGTFQSFNSVMPPSRGNWSVNGTTLIMHGRFPPSNYTYTFSNGSTRLWLESAPLPNITSPYLWNLTKS
jgi:hypothetical protein